jgi:hypothetical protein
MQHIKMFRYRDDLDCFVVSDECRCIADQLWLTEWNSVVWIGRLFTLDSVARARALFLSRKRPSLVGTFPGKKSQHSSLHCGFARSTNGSVGAAELVCSALAFPHPLVPLVISRRRRFRRHQSRWRVHPPGCASAPIPARSGAPQQHPLTHLYPDASRRSLAL